MIIRSIHIVRFGKLEELSISFDPKLHIIEGENESGKSTVSDFLRYMLYGFDREDPTDYGRGISRTHGVAEGSMLVEVGGKLYRLERKTVLENAKGKPRFTDESRMIDQQTGAITEDVCAGELWLGFPRAIFRRLATVDQISKSKVGDAGMRESIENLLFSGDERVNLRQAAARLTSQRDRLMTPDGKEGEIPRLRRRVADLKVLKEDACRVRGEMLHHTAKLEDARRGRQTAEKRLRELTEVDSLYRNTQLLIAFEKLHDIKAQTNAVSARLLEIKQENSHTGFIPDAEYLTELGVNRRLYAEAEEACAAAAADLREIESAKIIESDIQRNLQRAVKHGGEEAIAAKTAALHRKTSVSHLFAVLFALLALGCVALLAWMMPAFLAATSIEKILPYCLGLGGGLLVFLGVDIFLWVYASRHLKAERECYMDYSARNYREMRVRLRVMAEYRNQTADHIMRVRAARQYIETTDRVLGTSRETLERTLQRWGKELPEGDILEYTDQVEKAAKLYLDTVAALKEEKAMLDTTASGLRDQLRGQNESAIRAKVSPTQRKMMETVNPGHLAQEIASEKHRAEMLAKDEERYLSYIAKIKGQDGDPLPLAEELADAELALYRATMRYDALNLALSTFLDVGDRLKARITPRLASHTLEIVSRNTGGAYDGLELGDDLAIFLRHTGQEETFAPDLLSAGTRLHAYLALRIAMIDMVCRAEKPPLCLDETFAYQDDNRAMAIMKTLKEQADRGMQNLIFTCRAREEILAHQVFGPKVGYTKLGGADA